MKSIVLLTVVSVFCVAFTAYTTKYDDIDIDEILNNDRIYVKYFECLKGTGKCTPDAKDLKDVLPDALKNKCSECSEKQKSGADKVFSFVLEHKPQDFLVLEKLYDPERKFRVQYREEANKRGLKFPDK